VRVGGEADLVVDDEVDGASRGVAVEVREADSLEHDALKKKGGVYPYPYTYIHTYIYIYIYLGLRVRSSRTRRPKQQRQGRARST